MRICYIANANSIHTKRWIAPFVERGDQVYLLSYASVKRTWTGLQALVDLTRLSNKGKLRWVLWGWWVRTYVHGVKPDILHAHQLQAAGWLGVMASYRPLVVSSWGSDILVEPNKSILRRLLVRLVLRQCDCLTVPSPFMADAAMKLKFPEARLRLIPWGIETDVFQPAPSDCQKTRKQLGISPEATVILCPRSIRPIYNHEIVLKAVQAIRSQHPSLLLIFLNYNEHPNYLSRLKQLVISLELEDAVLWLPAQRAPEAMARLYRMADLIVSIPSQEGYGFSVYEAMACGRPTLITDLPVFEHELRDGVHTVKVPVQDVTQTATAIARLLDDQYLRQTLRQNGLNLAQQKSVQKRVEQTAVLYQELTASSVNRKRYP